MLTYKRGTGWVETPEETVTIKGVTYKCEDRKPEPNELGCWQWSAERYRSNAYHKSHRLWLVFLASNFTYIRDSTPHWLIQEASFTERDRQQQEWVTFVPC